MNSTEAIITKLKTLPTGSTIKASELIFELHAYSKVAIYKSLERLRNKEILTVENDGKFKITGQFPKSKEVLPKKVIKVVQQIEPYKVGPIDKEDSLLSQVRNCLSYLPYNTDLELERIYKTIEHVSKKSIQTTIHTLKKRGEIVSPTPGIIQILNLSKTEKHISIYSEDNKPTGDFSPFTGRPSSLVDYDNPITASIKDIDLVEYLSKLPSRKNLHLVEMEQYLEAVSQLNVLLNHKFLSYVGRGKFFLNYIPRIDQLYRLRLAAIHEISMVEEDEN